MRGPSFKTLAALLVVLVTLFVVTRPRLGPTSLTQHPWTLAAPQGVRQADFEAGRERRPSLLLGSAGGFELRASVPEQARLQFAWSAEPVGASVDLRIVARSASGETAFHQERTRALRGWSERSLDLSGFGGQALSLGFSVAGDASSVAVARPELVGQPSDADRPNVILYVVDCLRADHVGAYGYPRPTTPEIDRLARDGVLFEQVQACASWTKPAVGCLFTSLYPVFHGAQTVDDVLDPAVPTLAEAFRSEAYATAAWVANPFVAANPFGLTRGFDRVTQVLDKPPQVNINDLPADAAEITHRVQAWLEDNRDRRFFLYLHSLDLHAEYRRRPPFDRLFLSRQRTGEARQPDLYDNELAYNDREIGRLVSSLRQLGLYERTLIAVTADHGEEFGEHGFTRHGHTLYQGLLHVPLLLKLPQSQRRGVRVAALASSLDIAPTLLQLAGLPRPKGFQGQSLVPALEGHALRPRPAVFAEQLSTKEVLYAARDTRFKYVYQILPRPEAALYDLRDDPDETRSLLPDVPEAARHLRDELAGFVQIGQWGYHLSLAEARPEAQMRIEAQAEGTISDVQRFSLSAGETLLLSPDRRHLDYRFPAGDARRHLVLRTDPVDADLRLSLSRDGRPLLPASVSLGAGGRAPLGVPFTARAALLQVSPADAAALGSAEGLGVRLWYVPAPAPGPRAQLDPDLQEKLRVLGYIQ